VTSKPDANMARASKQPVAVTAAFLRRWQIPQPGSSGDKEDRGVALVIGGATEVPGAILLAELRRCVLAGKLQLAGPRSCRDVTRRRSPRSASFFASGIGRWIP